MATSVAVDAEVPMATAPTDERSETSASDSRWEKELTDAHSSNSLDVAAGAPPAPLEDATTDDPENADLLSLEQLAVEEIGAMLNSAAASAQATASALTGASELPNVDDLLSDLFGAAPAASTTDDVTPDPTPDPTTEPVMEAPTEPTAEAAPEPIAEAVTEAPPAPPPEPVAEAPATESAPEPPAEAPPEPSVETPAEPEAATPSAPEAAHEPEPKHVEHPAPEVAATAPVVTEPKPDARARGAALVTSLLQPVFKPLRAISAPVLKLPPMVRTLVGLFGLTLLPWVPAIWWLGSSVVAADRVRPLSETELVALTESLRTPSAGSGGHGEKKDAGGHGGGEKKADSHGAAKDEKPKEKAKEKPKEKAKEPAKKAESHH